MNRRNFIRAGALFLPTIFVPRLAKGQISPAILGPLIRKRSASGVYDPGSDAHAIYWYKADALALSDGASVSSWAASKGGIALTQATGANQPTFRSTGGPNGLNCVEHDGVNDFLTMASGMASTGQPFSFGATFKNTSSLLSSTTLWQGINGTSVNALSRSTGFFSMNGGSGSTDVPQSSNNNWNVGLFVYNSSTSKVAFNGGGLVSVTGNPGTSVLSNGSEQLRVGANFTPGNYAHLFLCELIIWDDDSAATAAARQAYLNRWGVY